MIVKVKIMHKLYKIILFRQIKMADINETDDLFEPNDMIDEYCIEGSLVIKTKNFVYKAFIPGEEKKYYVIKALSYQTSKDIEKFNREEDILTKLANQSFILPNISNIPYRVNIVEKNKDGQNEEKEWNFICRVSPFVENLDLRDFFLNKMLKCSSFEKGMKMTKTVFYKSLKILEILQENSIVHHDIKMQNFLVANLDTIDLILIDFEFAYQLEEGEKISRYCGTRPYIAPEVLLKKNHDISVDIWSLGVMIYFMYHGCFPFKISPNDKREDIYQKIVQNELEIDGRVPDECGNILIEMLQINPEKRLKPKDAVENHFFDDVRNVLPICEETKRAVSQMSDLQTELKSAEKIEDAAFDGNS